jgi:hypothetical protein
MIITSIIFSTQHEGVRLFSVEVLSYGFQVCHIIKYRDKIMNEIIFLSG